MSARRLRALLGGACVVLAAPFPGAAQVAPPDASPGPAPESAQPGSAPATIKTLPDKLEEAFGTWDLSRSGVNRRCTLVLSVESGANGRLLRFPAGCRRALPILSKVAGWLYLESGIRFVDEAVRPVLTFSASADRASLSARAETGEAYSLVPLQTAAMDALPPLSAGSDLSAHAAATPAVSDVPGARSIPGAEPVLPANVMIPPPGARSEGGPAPGTYAVDRFSDKDVCRIELAADRTTARADKGLALARILPGCRDSGVSVFDPVAWRYANGHMTLKARKGHAINLVETPDGKWRRDPDTGVTFVLRKVD